MKIAIVGLGYVGLPLCLQFARGGVHVVGLDIDPFKIQAINAGRSYIEHIEGAAIQKMVGEGRFSASSDFSMVEGVEAVIISFNSNCGEDLLDISSGRGGVAADLEEQVCSDMTHLHVESAIHSRVSLLY